MDKLNDIIMFMSACAVCIIIILYIFGPFIASFFIARYLTKSISKPWIKMICWVCIFVVSAYLTWWALNTFGPKFNR
jgi:hypothetical protein